MLTVTRPANLDCGACYNVCIEARERDANRIPFWVEEAVDISWSETLGCAVHAEAVADVLAA